MELYPNETQFMPLPPGSTVLYSTRQHEMLHVEGYLYRCGRYKYDFDNEWYDFTWMCKTDNCKGQANTIKIFDIDRKNGFIDKATLIASGNQFLNYNFTLSQLHSHQCDGENVVQVRVREINHSTKLAFLNPTNKLPALQAIKNLHSNYSASADPITRAASQYLPIADNCVRNLQKIRHKSFPKEVELFSPTDALTIDPNSFPPAKLLSIHEDPNLREHILLYHDKRDFVVGRLDDGSPKIALHVIMIFGTKTMMIELFKASRMFIDGTFQTCPKQFKQVMLIHHIINGFIVTAGYILLTGKHKYLIQWMLDELYNLAMRYQAEGRIDPGGPVISWTRITTDFEPSLLISFAWFRTKYGLMYETSCCHFHFCQLILRHARSTGFARLFTADKFGYKFKNFMRHIMALPFLPLRVPGVEQQPQQLSRITVVFNLLVAKLIADINTSLPLNTPHTAQQNAAIMVIVNSYIFYLNRYWMDTTSNYCVPQKYFCVEGIVQFRTNNNAEGVNNRARLDFGVKPKLFKWIDIVKSWTVYDTHVMNLLNGEHAATHKHREKKYVKKDNSLSTYKDQLISGNEESELNFIKKVAKHVLDKKSKVIFDNDIDDIIVGAMNNAPVFDAGVDVAPPLLVGVDGGVENYGAELMVLLGVANFVP